MATLGEAIKATAKSLRDTLAGAGVPASLNPGDVMTPGAWVQTRTATPETMTAWRVRFHVYLIAPDASAMEAWDVLSPMLDKALTVVDPDESINTATSVVLPHGPTALPAIQLVIDELVDVEAPEEA